MIIALILSIFISGSYAATTVDLICSGSVGYLNQTDRNINFISNNYRCDSAIPRGYYTFGPDAKIPNTCQKIGSCASDAPLWTTDIQPNAISQGPVDIKLCSSVSSTGVDALCSFRCNVVVTAVFCSNINAVVYEMFSVPMCNARYCYEKLVPCDVNEISESGYQPCIPSTFPFNLLDTSTKLTTYGIKETDNRFKNINGTSLLCSIKCPPGLNCSQISGEVLWFVKMYPSSINKTTLYFDSDTNELYSYLEEKSWTRHINNYFYCSITPSLNGNKTYESYKTPLYYAGLVLQINKNNGITEHRYPDTNEITLVIEEAATSNAILSVYSSIPILCDPLFSNCSLIVQMAAETIFKEYDSLRLTNCVPSGECGACSKTIKNQTIPNSSNSASFQIIATIEDKNIRTNDRMKLSLKTKYHYSLAGNFFADLMLPIINVDFRPKNVIMAISQSIGDPRLVTHDGTIIQFHGYNGEYLVMENIIALLRVHLISRLCSSIGMTPGFNGEYCNSEIYIQSIDDLVYYSHTSRDTLFYKDLSNPTAPTIKLFFEFKNSSYATAVIPKKSAIQVTREGVFFIITTHFATRIKINKNSGNFEVFPSKYDLGNVYGLLGDYNKNKNNDLTETKCGRVTTLDAYFNCYRVTRTFLANNQYYPFKNGSDPTQYCMCVNNVNSTILCPLGLKLEQSVKYRSSTSLIITMDTLVDITKKSKIFEPYINFKYQIMDNKRIMKSSISLCESTLNITIFQECYKQDLIDLPTLITLCELDFDATGSNYWTESYYEVGIDSCKEKLSGDSNNFVVTNNGDIVPQLDLLEKLCPDDCNKNGKCEEGVCKCFSPYDGFDCSIDTSTPLEIYNSSAINDICSSNITSNCLNVLLLVNRITSKLELNYDILYKNNKGEFKLLEKQSSNVLLISDNVLYAQLENNIKISSGYLSVYYYNITIKDNSTSNSLMYTIYNDDCHECINSFDCKIKPNKCDIDSVCYHINDKNPFNYLQVCNPNNNNLGWTEIPTTTTSTTTTSTTTTSTKTTSTTTTSATTTSTSTTSTTTTSTTTISATTTSTSTTLTTTTSTSTTSTTTESTTVNTRTTIESFSTTEFLTSPMSSNETIYSTTFDSTFKQDTTQKTTQSTIRINVTSSSNRIFGNLILICFIIYTLKIIILFN